MINILFMYFKKENIFLKYILLPFILLYSLIIMIHFIEKTTMTSSPFSLGFIICVFLSIYTCLMIPQEEKYFIKLMKAMSVDIYRPLIIKLVIITVMNILVTTIITTITKTGEKIFDIGITYFLLEMLVINLCALFIGVAFFKYNGLPVNIGAMLSLFILAKIINSIFYLKSFIIIGIMSIIIIFILFFISKLKMRKKDLI